MAPQPYTVNGRLTIFTIVSGLEHRMRVPTRIQTPIATPAQLICFPSGGTPTIQASLAAQNLWDSAREMYDHTIGPAAYLLEQNAGGSFIPIESAALVNNGSQTTTIQLAQELTWSFAGFSNHRLKIVMLETDFPYLLHEGPNTPNANLLQFFNYVAENTGAPNGNAWITTRSGDQIKRAILVTAGLNKRVKRSRHDE